MREFISMVDSFLESKTPQQQTKSFLVASHNKSYIDAIEIIGIFNSIGSAKGAAKSKAKTNLSWEDGDKECVAFSMHNNIGYQIFNLSGLAPPVANKSLSDNQIKDLLSEISEYGGKIDDLVEYISMLEEALDGDINQPDTSEVSRDRELEQALIDGDRIEEGLEFLRSLKARWAALSETVMELEEELGEENPTELQRLKGNK